MTPNDDDELHARAVRQIPGWAQAWVPLHVVGNDFIVPRKNARIYVPATIGHPANVARSRLRASDYGDPQLRAAALLPALPVQVVPSPTLIENLTSKGPVAVPQEDKLFEPKPSNRRRRGSPGMQVEVIKRAALDRYVADASTVAMRKTREEAKMIKEFAVALEQRGGRRTVALHRRWRAGLDKLRDDMPNFAPVVDHVYRCCAVSEFVKAPLRVRPMLLVGLPGLGKSCFAVRLADVIGVPRFFYAMDAAETISTLAGSDKHWANSEPGQLFRMILLGEIANPVIVLDELDKAVGGGSSANESSRYRPANALHGVLEPETARALRDKSADIVFDASHAIYVATANKLSTIDGALLSRFTLFHIDVPDSRAAVSIAQSVARSVLEEFRLVEKFDRVAGEVLQQLALLGNPRLQRKALEAAIGQAVCAGRRALALSDLTAFATPAGDARGQPMRTH